MAIRSVIPSTRTTYKQLNAAGRKHGDSGDTPDVTRGKALGFVARHIAKGFVLTAGWSLSSKTGNLCITICLVGAKTVIHSPSLDALALGMGVIAAARFLIYASRLRSNKGSVAYDDASINQFENDQDANMGIWSENEQ